LTLFAPPQRPQGGRKPEFKIYVPLVQKMLHIKFEKNWRSGYQVEVKNLQMLTDTIYHVWPHPGGKTATQRIINFKHLVGAFLLYIIMHSVFPPHVQL
jgi:hypothetical protein